MYHHRFLYTRGFQVAEVSYTNSEVSCTITDFIHQMFLYTRSFIYHQRFHIPSQIFIYQRVSGSRSFLYQFRGFIYHHRFSYTRGFQVAEVSYTNSEVSCTITDFIYQKVSGSRSFYTNTEVSYTNSEVSYTNSEVSYNITDFVYQRVSGSRSFLYQIRGFIYHHRFHIPEGFR